MIKRTKIWDKIRPYEGVIYFMVILLAAHFFWKYSFVSNSAETIITFYGLDLSNFFNIASTNLSKIVYLILNGIGYETDLLSNNVIIHQESQNYAQIVWGCTSIKQIYIFICIILFYKGDWKHKSWYIPLGVLLIYLFNIFRITFIMGIIDKHPEQFAFWHEQVMKYLFYFFIFGLWAFWNEKFTSPKKENKVSNKKQS